MKDTVRNNIQLIFNNASYNDDQKRRAIDFLIKLEDMSKLVDPTLAPDELPRRATKGTPDTTCDPDLIHKFPKTFSELVLQAENNILPDEIPRRYFPPESKVKPYRSEY